jgi:thiamine biosynthesis lipoprotein
LDNYFYKINITKAQLLLGFLVFLFGCSQQKDLIYFSGLTMGTTYSIKAIPLEKNIDTQILKKGIDSVLVTLNKRMSTWDPNSEISQFNLTHSTEPFVISESFRMVVKEALNVSEKTDGFFDITVFDLMGIWGFGPDPNSGIPDQKQIETTLSFTGHEKINVTEKTIIKKHPETKLDLNAIAKGYAVDKVFHFLQSKGFIDLFVEIGGEVQCAGRNQLNKYWSIGIENPSGGNKSNQNFAAIVYSDGGAVATSGNYRNFIELDGEILGHTINPKTGYPIRTNVLSVTVLSNSCMVADAWATALMVMDYETGLKKVTENPYIKAVWILDESDGSRVVAKSVGVTIDDSIYKIIS